MTQPAFLDDAYKREAPARVSSHTAEGGIVRDRARIHT